MNRAFVGQLNDLPAPTRCEQRLVIDSIVRIICRINDSRRMVGHFDKASLSRRGIARRVGNHRTNPKHHIGGGFGRAQENITIISCGNECPEFPPIMLDLILPNQRCYWDGLNIALNTRIHPIGNDRGRLLLGERSLDTSRYTGYYQNNHPGGIWLLKIH